MNKDLYGVNQQSTQEEYDLDNASHGVSVDFGYGVRDGFDTRALLVHSLEKVLSVGACIDGDKLKLTH